MFGLGLALMATAVGCVAAMVGAGGGFLVVPMLVLVWGISAQEAAGTSLLMIVFTSSSSTIAYHAQGRIDYLLGLILAAGTVPGALLGASAATHLKSEVLSGLLGIFLLGISIRMLIARELPDRRPDPRRGTRTKVDAHGHIFEYPRISPLALPAGFAGGLASGLFGIGGGVLIVPLIRLGMGIPMHIASATSMFMMIFTSIAGASTHAYLGNVRVRYAIPLCLGIVVGTQIGAFLARRTRAKALERILGVCLSIIGGRLLFEMI